MVNEGLEKEEEPQPISEPVEEGEESVKEEEPQPTPEPVKEEGGEDEVEDLSDMFEVPKQGMEKEDLSDLVTITDEEEDELVGVSEEDVLGEDEEPEPEPVLESEEEEPHWSDEDIKRYRESQRSQVARNPVIRRTTKPYTPPGQIGGVK